MANLPEPCDSMKDESEAQLQAYLIHKLGSVQSDIRIWDWLNFFNVLDEFSFNIRTINHHYSHENCHRLELDGYTGRDNVDSIVDDCANELNELRRSLCQAIYSSLRDKYDYLTSDEAIAESLESNEYEFDVNGNPA